MPCGLLLEELPAGVCTKCLSRKESLTGSECEI